MRYWLGILTLLGLALGQALTPKSIIVNPTPPPDLQVRVWVDKDPNKTGNPVYRFGENIQISVQVTQPAYVYLFSVRATGEISGILPNAFEQENFLQAGEVRTFPGLGAPYTFTVEGPAGQDRVLAVASRRPLDVSEIVDIQTGRPASRARATWPGPSRLWLRPSPPTTG
ncbi:DUF4384 domain-containing protein [Meiothermus taiwanensis]|uniref:DUF4384 domain-containing protein n=1 Tax=Meiothermus taiwanensis TaxID=172827 RepID=UPI000ADC341C|nr:DUF4384 domain-containing protein [Meiothermus taiwanensis]